MNGLTTPSKRSQTGEKKKMNIQLLYLTRGEVFIKKLNAPDPTFAGRLGGRYGPRVRQGKRRKSR